MIKQKIKINRIKTDIIIENSFFYFNKGILNNQILSELHKEYILLTIN